MAIRARSRERALFGATGLLLVALFVALRLLGPERLPASDVCLFHRATGYACPACGMTRAAAAFARGDFHASAAFHPLFPLLAAEAGALLLLWGAELFGGPGARSLAARARAVVPAAAIATGVLMLLLWVGRAALGTLP